MVDIHYHLLFGVDDGPGSLEESLRLAEASIAEGVTHLVCTPHANDHYKFDPGANRQKLQMLNDHLNGTIALGLGCDFHLSYDNILDLRAHPTKYTINGHRYLLVEFPDFAIPLSMTETLHGMVASGLVPIITHPERNPTLVADQKRLADWIRCGCLIQVTAGSLDGRFGRKAQTMCYEWLRKHWVHFVASDAHSIAHRPPSMGRAHHLLTQNHGVETADRLCIGNPAAVFAGEPLPRQPEAIALSEEAGAGESGLWRRIFTR